MAGSLAQARRSAARASAVGTPSARNSRTLALPSIASSGGKLGGVFGAGAGLASSGEAFGEISPRSGAAAGGAASRAAARLRRDHRARNFSSAMAVPRGRSSPRQRLGIGAVALALLEFMLG